MVVDSGPLVSFVSYHRELSDVLGDCPLSSPVVPGVSRLAGSWNRFRRVCPYWR